jgi:hypothetical protein
LAYPNLSEDILGSFKETSVEMRRALRDGVIVFRFLYPLPDTKEFTDALKSRHRPLEAQVSLNSANINCYFQIYVIQKRQMLSLAYF